MIISTISLQLAKVISTSSFDEIEKFAKEADANEYTTFTHYNFFYSYPEWGKKWPNNKICEFHAVDTKCHLCNYRPDRNYAGVGRLYILNNGVGEDKIWVIKGYKVQKGRKIPLKQLVDNRPELSRMVLLCENHIKSHFEWSEKKQLDKKTYIQLELF